MKEKGLGRGYFLFDVVLVAGMQKLHEQPPKNGTNRSSISHETENQWYHIATNRSREMPGHKRPFKTEQ